MRLILPPNENAPPAERVGAVAVWLARELLWQVDQDLPLPLLLRLPRCVLRPTDPQHRRQDRQQDQERAEFVAEHGYRGSHGSVGSRSLPLT